METSVCGAIVEPHRYLGFSRKSNQLSCVLAHLKRPVILSPVLQGEGPPYFVLPLRRDAAQRTTNTAWALPRVPTYNAGVLRPENGAQDDSTFVGWWEGGWVVTDRLAHGEPRHSTRDPRSGHGYFPAAHRRTTFRAAAALNIFRNAGLRPAPADLIRLMR